MQASPSSIRNQRSSPNHAINALLDTQHVKNQVPHRFTIPNLSDKQKNKLTSPVIDINNHLLEITSMFDPLNFFFSPGHCLVDHFSNRIQFHFPLSSSKDGLHSVEYVLHGLLFRLFFLSSLSSDWLVSNEYVCQHRLFLHLSSAHFRLR